MHFNEKIISTELTKSLILMSCIYNNKLTKADYGMMHSEFTPGIYTKNFVAITHRCISVSILWVCARQKTVWGVPYWAVTLYWESVCNKNTNNQNETLIPNYKVYKSETQNGIIQEIMRNFGSAYFFLYTTL